MGQTVEKIVHIEFKILLRIKNMVEKNKPHMFLKVLDLVILLRQVSI